MAFLAVVEGDAGAWRIDRDALTDAIRARWSGVETDSISLAVVFRGLAPVDLDLVFCDDGCTLDARLRARTTEAESTDLVNAAG